MLARRLTDRVLPDFSRDGFDRMPIAIQRIAIERTCVSFLEGVVRGDRTSELSLPHVDQRQKNCPCCFAFHAVDGARPAGPASSRIAGEIPGEGAAR